MVDKLETKRQQNAERQRRFRAMLKTPEKKDKLQEYSEKKKAAREKRHEEQSAKRQRNVNNRGFKWSLTNFIACHGLCTFYEASVK